LNSRTSFPAPQSILFPRKSPTKTLRYENPFRKSDEEEISISETIGLEQRIEQINKKISPKRRSR
jgi:hypothetical protein